MIPQAYHDYSIILTSLDAEWTRNSASPLDGFEKSRRQIEEACELYRESRIANQAAWQSGRVAAGWAGGGTLDDWLFKARSWIPFGHADLFCMVLVDDLDAGQSIVELYPKTIEEVTLGFCPDLRGSAHACPLLVEPGWFI